MATINKNNVNAANKYNSLYTKSGMANALLILSNIQFSIFRLANNHIPAHAVDDTQASQTGTSESVKWVSDKDRMKKPTTTIASTIPHSLALHLVIGCSFASLWVFQYHHP